MIGKASAQQAWRRSRIAVTSLRGRIDELGINCDLTGKQSLYLAGTTLGPSDLSAEAEARREAGIAANYLTATALKPLFRLEIAFRTVFIYLYTLILIRWIGSRSIAQPSLVEFLLVIALGSAVGDTMFYPDVPLVHGLIVITLVVLLDKGLAYIVARNPVLEDVIEGKSVEVVRDGVIAYRALKALNFELFEQLRLKDVAHLGQVRGAYLETNGSISVFKFEADANRPGLSIAPSWDVSEPPRMNADSTSPRQGKLACPLCATVTETSANQILKYCPNCNGSVWHEAI